MSETNKKINQSKDTNEDGLLLLTFVLVFSLSLANSRIRTDKALWISFSSPHFDNLNYRKTLYQTLLL